MQIKELLLILVPLLIIIIIAVVVVSCICHRYFSTKNANTVVEESVTIKKERKKGGGDETIRREGGTEEGDGLGILTSGDDEKSIRGAEKSVHDASSSFDEPPSSLTPIQFPNNKEGGITEEEEVRDGATLTSEKNNDEELVRGTEKNVGDESFAESPPLSPLPPRTLFV